VVTTNQPDTPLFFNCLNTRFGYNSLNPKIPINIGGAVNLNKTGYVFIAVNYGTEDYVENWVASIRRCIEPAKIIIVDNYKSDASRTWMKELAKEMNFTLIESANIGYGGALNKGVNFALANSSREENEVFFLSNLDVEFDKIPPLVDKRSSYLPSVLQNGRERNPFMTVFQRKVIFQYDLAAKLNSVLLLKVAVAITKVLGLIPSQVYAMHGSCFCISKKAISAFDTSIFNDESFLYCEELEFAEYIKKNGVKIEKSEIACKHIGGVATGPFFNTKSAVFPIWRKSWLHWRSRW